MEDEPLAVRVGRGAALLDERSPGWFRRIDTDRLHIASSTQCVLAQLYTGYDLGKEALDIAWGESARHGFVCGDGPVCVCDWLTDIWKGEIARRRQEED